MPKSMTGFGRGEGRYGNAEVICEIRTVNAKFLDITAKLPSCGTPFEGKIKNILNEYGISRGKADIRFELEYTLCESSMVSCDASLARAYLNAMNELSEELGEGRVFTVRDVIGKPDVLRVTDAEISEEDFSAAAEIALRAACGMLSGMRRREGEKLMIDLEDRLRKCEKLVSSVESMSEETKKAYFSRLRERLMRTLEEYRIEPDGQRILTECAIFADKIAVDEETVRLRSHFDAFRELTVTEEACGRKLDFLVQEMNREANTIGSKCSDASVAHLVVELKNEIEKIREQIQNIE